MNLDMPPSVRGMCSSAKLAWYKKALSYAKAEIERLEAIVEVPEVESLHGDIASALSLPPALANVLNAIYSRRGNFVSNRMIEDLYEPAHYRSTSELQMGNLIKVQVSKLRKIVPKDGIQNVWGQGYKMSHECVKFIDDALARQRLNDAA